MSWMRVLNASWWIGLLILSGIPVWKDIKSNGLSFDDLSAYSSIWLLVASILFFGLMIIWTVSLYS